MPILVNDICEEQTKSGVCGKPLNARGECNYWRNHLTEQELAEEDD